jgi:SAM-dependent methyltransferase
MKPQNSIKINKKLHKKIADKYWKRHPEIFNDIEQKRLSDFITKVVTLIKSNQAANCGLPIVIDYGCGDGNITNHLINHDVKIIAADVTPKFLHIIKKLFNDNDRIETRLLNGIDLKEFDTESADAIIEYSVLHHIPDYLYAIKDMIRVLKPGGILYLDHDVSEEIWEKDNLYNSFHAKYNRKSISNLILSLINPLWYIKKIRKIINPRYQVEGDIHVWLDDHIEWKKIEKVLLENGMRIIESGDYLNYKPCYPLNDYLQAYQNIADMHYIIAQKQ